MNSVHYTMRGRWHAPRQDGHALIDPPAGALIEQLSTRSFPAGLPDVDCAGRPLAALAEETRGAVLKEAIHYSRKYRSVEIPGDARTVVVTGHQPELFHPGVWFKNFVAAHLAARLGGVAVHLVIDNDLPRGLTLKCPTWQDTGVAVQRCPIDLGGPLWPYEDRPVRDRQLLRSASDRVAACVGRWGVDALVRDFWPILLQAAERSDRIGYAIAEARHRFEARWGLQTVELPLSSVCRLAPVRWWFAWLLCDAPRLHREYNAALEEHQWEQRRTSQQPAATLRYEKPWYELPFWAWTADHPVRQPLWCRVHRECIELSTRGRLRLCLPRCDVPGATDALAQAEANRVRLRPRALLTTLTARCLLGDLFIHGIGGAHYDQVTDRLATRLWGSAPPAYATVTATLWLPVQHTHVGQEEVTAARVALRQLQFHPEAFVEGMNDPRVVGLVEEKERWKRQVSASERRLQYQTISRINEELQPYVEPLKRRWLERLEELERRHAVCQVLDARDYSFVLFPEDYLKDAFSRLWEASCATGLSVVSRHPHS
ncbi:MAG: hypothetical protein KatS3mg110_2720 [Pirellulaceae bacterium]|nr:MAG: hypothetical protein KatS3mg110_2720 [Pirellulaceae bacterium]